MKVQLAMALMCAALSAAPASALESGSFENWLSAAVQNRMDRLGAHAAAGQKIATVSFERGAEGSPSGVRVEKSTGNEELDRLAVQTVASLGQLPASSPDGRHFVVLDFSQPQRVDRRTGFETAMRGAEKLARAARQERLARRGGTGNAGAVDAMR